MSLGGVETASDGAKRSVSDSISTKKCMQSTEPRSPEPMRFQAVRAPLPNVFLRTLCSVPPNKSIPSESDMRKTYSDVTRSELRLPISTRSVVLP